MKKTLRYESDAPPYLTVDTVVARVVEGPDAGLVVAGDSDTMSVGTADGNALVLTDPTVSRFHADLVCAPDGVWVRDQGSTNGTHVNGVRVTEALLPVKARLQLGRTVLRLDPSDSVDLVVHSADHIGDIYGRSAVMRRLMTQVARVAASGASTLVVGESGTGKELIARAIHDLSDRSSGPFVTVDCGAMAPNLVASELFGHERGAFTGADHQHAGAFERAHGGTLFFDEVGELSPELQPTLLGALERKRFRRVGGRAEIDVDVRVVAATHRDLRAEVNAGKFRLDLYYRLAVVRLEVPALRARVDEDLELLVSHFLSECGVEDSPEAVFGPEVLAALRQHHWPGNVRELRNVVEATVAMGEPPSLSRSLVGDEGAVDGSGQIALPPLLPLPYKDARAAVLARFEARYLAHWLDKAEGNVSKAARLAKVDRSHFFHLLRRHGLR